MKYFITFLFFLFWALPGLAQQISFPAGIQCKVRPYYGYRPDGTPGRELMLKFTGGKFPGKAKVEIASGRIRETIETDEQVGDSLIVLLPEGIGVRENAQVDLPGMSWGVAPVMVHEGVKYIMMFQNTARGNSEMTYSMNQKPFWWVAQDGRSKVLFLQPGGYAVGLAKGGLTGRPWFGQQDTAKIPKVVKTDNPRENFLDKHLFTVLPKLEKEKHPYDIYVVTWAMWDNSLQNADLPEAVRSWNEECAYPKLIISGGHQIMETFERMYGDKLPVMEKDGIHFGSGFDIPRSTTRIDIPWSIMRLEEDQWPSANRAWIPHQHWVDISNENSGVTWCSPDAALIESGSITANNTAGWDGKGVIWPSKLRQSSLIYSWVMNNHWYTNTPQTQEGPVTFRYMIKPHGAYDAAEANRFGLEQMQPPVHVLCDKNPMEKPLLSIDNSRLSVNILKSSENGSSMIVRVRSLSSVDEILNLKWPVMKPAKVFLCDRGEEAGSKEVSGGITVPVNGFVTLKVI